MAYVVANQGGKAILLSDTTVNESSKDLDLETLLGGSYEILALRIEFTASVEVGTRIIVLRVMSGADIIFEMDIEALEAIVASASATVHLVPNLSVADFVRNSLEYQWMPPILLPKGAVLRVVDRADIDDGVDDMVIHATVRAI